jgi:hypothetical protein
MEAADRPNLHALFEDDDVEEYGSIFDDPSWG